MRIGMVDNFPIVTLDLSYNRIRKFPVGIFGQGTDLEKLYVIIYRLHVKNNYIFFCRNLSDNIIEELEEGCLGNLGTLKYFDLSSNKISAFPPQCCGRNNYPRQHNSTGLHPHLYATRRCVFLRRPFFARSRNSAICPRHQPSDSARL